MKTELKEINSYTLQLEVVVDWSILENRYKEEFKKASANYNIPGFRKGKVPEKIVKKNLGPSIEAHFADSVLNEYYKSALDKLKITPINQAKINKMNFKEGEDLSFSAEFEIEPQIDLPKYQNKIKVRTIRYMAENMDVEQTLNQYREQHANIKTIEGGAKTGHFIRGDFQIIDDNGEPKKNSILENQYIKLGSGLFKDDKEKVFLNSKQGDVVKVSIPGKEHVITYQVTIKNVEEQILPEVDDKLAKTINENANNLDDLKKIIHDQIQSSLDKDNNDAIKKEIINYFVQNTKIDAPASMVARYLDHVKEDFKKRKQPIDELELNEKYKSQAEWNIKWYIIKDKLLLEEKLDISNDEINEKINSFISDNIDNKSQIESYYKKDDNKQRLYEETLNDKLFQKLQTYASIKTVEKSTSDLRKEHANK